MFKQNTRLATRLARASVPTVPQIAPLRTRGFSSRGPKTLVTSVQTNEAYAPFAHYSQAIKAAGQVWLSGQIPADAEGNLIKGSITEQTEIIIKNTEAILKASGTGLERVVKVVLFVGEGNVGTVDQEIAEIDAGEQAATQDGKSNEPTLKTNAEAAAKHKPENIAQAPA
ncbi:hypothetical protein PENANT_c001G04504 [Penicillium antarcticum]|uniref:Uncharacterized protein n=1 Tax=Penicillium antarcticum TaxID=416450 RepID=A0A1V6QNS7_9EURO|nr:hypothetical protein PENANT_c001G04504 [Penicillium antarcticum]